MMTILTVDLFSINQCHRYIEIYCFIGVVSF